MIEDADRFSQAAALPQRGEAQYRAVIESSQDGFWIIDLQGRLLEANAAYARLSGYSIEELRAMRIADLEADENPSEIAAHMEKVLREGSDLFRTWHRAKSGRLWYAEVNVAYWPIGGGQFIAFIRDIHRRQRSEALLKARLTLSDIAHKSGLDDLLQAALDTMEEFTGSRIGFFHFVDPDQEHITMQAWSTNTLRNLCEAHGKGLHYPISQAGVWVECVHRRAPVIHNDYASLPDRKGLPEGHAPVARELTVPIVRGDSIIAIVGVGNKPEDYTDDDVAAVQELVSMTMDLVERKRIEQTLRYYERIVAATPDSVALLDRHYVYLAVNDEYLRRTGRPRDRIVGRTVGDVMGEEIFQTLLKGKLDRCLAGELVQFQTWFDFAAKGRRFIDVTYAPYRDETGAIAGVAVNARDITDLKLAEESLRQTQERLELAVDGADLGLYDVNLQTGRAEVNEHYLRMLGLAPGETATTIQSWLDSIHPDDRPRVLQIVEEHETAGRDRFEAEYRVRHRSGKWTWILDRGRGLDWDENGRPRRAAGTHTDITERKRAEALLAENTERLHQLSRGLLSVQEEERRALARELHDDLGQQLAALKLNLTVLERALPDASSQRRIADCARIVDSAHEHIQNTARNLRPSILDDLGLAAALRWYARSQTERTGCEIDVRAKIPPLPPELETAAFRIVQEAVNNAIRHGGARRIAVTLAVDTGALELAIQDDGAGFDPDALAAGRKSGLGLISMRERVELFGGRFALDSRPGAGTSVEATIPLVETAP